MALVRRRAAAGLGLPQAKLQTTPPIGRLAQVLRNRLTTGVFWNVLGGVFNQGSTFVLGVVVAHVLGRELYGRYGFLQSTLLMFSTLAQLALGFVTTKYLAEFRVAQKERAARVIAVSITVSILTGIVATLIAVGGSGIVASRMVRQADLAPLIRLGAPTVLFTVVVGVLTGALAGLERFRTIAISGVIAGTLYLSICATGALLWGLPGVVAGLAASSALQCLVLASLLVREGRRAGIGVSLAGPADIASERGMLLHTALPAALSGFTTIPTLWLMAAILARQTGGMSQLALFTAANSLRLLVSFIPTLINNAGFSVLSSHKGSADFAAYRSTFRMNVMVVVGAALLGGAVLAAAGPLILRIFGRSFGEAYPVLLVLLLATIPEAFAISIYQVVQTHGSMWWSLIGIAVPRDLSSIACALLLAPRYGAVGLAAAIVVAWLVTLGGTLLCVQRQGAFATKAFRRALRRRRTIATVDGVRYDFDLGEVIDLNVYLNAFEPDVTAAIRRYTKPGMTVLDIGANIGAHALRFAQLVGSSGRVVAFEPTAFAFTKLKRNREMNDFPQLELVHLALSDVARAAQRVNFRSSWRTDGSRMDGPSTVDFLPLDVWCSRQSLEHVDIVRIDVDGNEYPIFAGGRNLFAKSRPVILMEAVSPHFASDATNPFLFLEALGYDFWMLGDGRAVTVGEIGKQLPDEDAGMTVSFNVLATPGQNRGAV